MSCPFCVSCIRQLSITEGFPWPQQHRMAQARSVSNYASNCPRLQYIEQISLPVCLLLLPLSSSVLLVFSLSNTRQTCSRCVMCIIQATVYFVCVNAICLKLWRMFKSTKLFLFALSVKAVLQIYLNACTASSASEWVGSVGHFAACAHAHMWHTDVITT